MQLHDEFRRRLASEYRYAVTKMQETTEFQKKLYYFSVFYGEAQRVLNWQWNTELALIHTVAQNAHAQATAAMRPGFMDIFPLDWAAIADKLTLAASDLATYFEKTEYSSSEELYQILGRLAEITYAVTGNGSYLYEKGLIQL